MSLPAGAPLSRSVRRQHGIATRGQLTTSGLSISAIRAQLTAHRWRSLNDHVVCTHNGPLTRTQALWAVLLSAPEPAALCGLTVLELLHVAGFATAAVHVVVPHGARVLPVENVAVAVHESRRFNAEDIRIINDFRTTGFARSFVDAAAWSHDELTASRVVVVAVQQQRLHPVELSRELEAAGQVRHRRLLRLLLADLEGGAQALSEVEFLAFCRRHHLPRPMLQWRLDSAGRRRYLDATFTRGDGKLVRAEIDGGVHLTLTARLKDTGNDNDAIIDGELVLRFLSVAICTDDARAVAQLRRALRLRPQSVSA